MKSGIYRIVNILNGKIYIGSSIVLKERRFEHFRCLKKKTHPNGHLQKSFNKYGIESFKFEVVEYCGEVDLIVREQFYIDQIKRPLHVYAYNISPTAGRTTGIKLSDEHKALISYRQTGERNPKSDKKKYTWFHKDHGEVNCTRYEMKKLYGIKSLETGMLLNGYFISSHGWYLDKYKPPVVRRVRKDIDESLLVKEYSEGCSIRTLSKRHKLAEAGVFARLKKAGVLRTKAESAKLNARTDIDIVSLISQYNSGMAMCRLKVIYNVSGCKFKSILKENNIKIRGRSEAISARNQPV